MGISTYEIPVPKTLLKTVVEKDLELEANLPEYCPDIARLIRVDCTPFAASCTASGSQATVSGKAVYDVLYETDYKNRLKYCSFTQDFSSSVSLPKAGEGVAVFCTPKCRRINCKLISPRKLVLKAVLDTDFEIEGEAGVKAVAVNEDGNSFFAKKTMAFSGKTEEFFETFGFSDSVVLSQSEKTIGEIVFGNISLQDPQVKLIPGCAEVKTVADLKILCEEENNEGKYFSVSKALPVSFSFKNDNVEDFKDVSVSVMPVTKSFTSEFDQYGESRVIKTDFEIKASLRINDPKAYTVATDMFERDFTEECVTEQVSVPIVHAHSEEGFTAEAKFFEISPRPTAVLEASVRESGNTVTLEEKGVNINGIFAVNLLTETPEGIFSLDKALEYSQFIALDMPEGKFSADVKIAPTEIITTLHSDGSITARVVAVAKISVKAQKEESFVSDVLKRTPITSKENENDIIFRFPQKGESLWDIAKSYRTDPDVLLSENSESFDENGLVCENPKPIIIKA